MCQNANLKGKLYQSTLLYKCNKLHPGRFYRLYKIFTRSLFLLSRLLVLKPDNSACLKAFSCVNIHVVCRFQSYSGKYKFQYTCIQNCFFFYSNLNDLINFKDVFKISNRTPAVIRA